MESKKNVRAKTSSSGTKTNFGFLEVTEDEKTLMVGNIFSSVAARYDLMNDLMSAGIHRLWKSDLIRAINPVPGLKIVDVGGGTGDVAFGILKNCACHVTICDINEEMISVGRDRSINKGHLENPAWICGDAAALPIPECYADVYVTAFCLRNASKLQTALREARRILKPGGHFVCLEFSKFDLKGFT